MVTAEWQCWLRTVLLVKPSQASHYPDNSSTCNLLHDNPRCACLWFSHLWLQRTARPVTAAAGAGVCTEGGSGEEGLQRPAELVGNHSAICDCWGPDSPFHGFDSPGVIQQVCGCTEVVCCP